MNCLISIYIFTLAVIPSVFSFSWEDCGDASSPIKIQELTLTTVQDIFYISMEAEVAENITEPVEAKLKIKRRVSFANVYVNIPCVNNMGSCDYENICDLTPWETDSCPDIFTQNNIPCRCPILQNHYSIKEAPLDLKRFGLDIPGVYKIELSLSKDTKDLFCIRLKVQI